MEDHKDPQNDLDHLDQADTVRQEHGFAPAPNPFEHQPEHQAPPVPEHNGVVLVGKTADEKPAAQIPASDAPKQKTSLLRSIFGTNKKPDQKSDKVEHPKVAEQILMSWQAPEFVQTHKPLGWYLGFVGFFAVLIALAIYTQQYLTVGLFALMGVALVLYANRPPRVLEYKISNYGVYVGEKKYVFDDFGSYYEASDYGQPVLELVPNKRFGTLVSMPPKHDEVTEVESTLSQMLPKVDNREDFVDKLFRALRF